MKTKKNFKKSASYEFLVSGVADGVVKGYRRVMGEITLISLAGSALFIGGAYAWNAFDAWKEDRKYSSQKDTEN